MEMLHSTLLTPIATLHNKRQFIHLFILFSNFQKHQEAHFVQINKHDGKLSQSESYNLSNSDPTRFPVFPRLFCKQSTLFKVN